VTPDYPNARDCEHGQLRRSCERCEDAREINALGAEVERLTRERDAALDAMVTAHLREDAKDEGLRNATAIILAAEARVATLEAALADARDEAHFSSDSVPALTRIYAICVAALGDQEAPTEPPPEYEQVGWRRKANGSMTIQPTAIERTQFPDAWEPVYVKRTAPQAAPTAVCVYCGEGWMRADVDGPCHGPFHAGLNDEPAPTEPPGIYKPGVGYIAAPQVAPEPERCPTCGSDDPTVYRCRDGCGVDDGSGHGHFICHDPHAWHRP
jgi:hypothetical protein